jgi:hypothetical protein
MTTGYLAEQSTIFEQSLARANLTPEEVKFDKADMALWGSQKYGFKLLDVFFDNPWKISFYTRAISNQLLTAKSDLAILAYNAHRRMDTGVNPALNTDLLEKYQQQVEKLGDNALTVALHQLTNKPADSFKAQSKNLPPKLRSAVAQFLFAVPDALKYREFGLLRSLTKLQLDPPRTYADVVDFAVTTVEESEEEKPEQVLLIESLLDNVDFNLLNTGAIIIASATQELQNQLCKINLVGDYEYSVETPQGRIVLSGKGNQNYANDDYLLIVDADGNDTYAGGAANRNIDHGVSVILDLAGRDRYISISGTAPSFGAGIFGYGVLMDMQGDDQYEAEYQSQGIGLFGTGILYDAKGNDTYRGIRNLQGSGIFGYGLLIDKVGSDRYYLYTYGQGYGYTKGVGILLDGAGDDQYIGLEDKYPNGGPFGEKMHIHFAQGAALGRRGEYADGKNWAGGIGMLVDGGGNDRYECEVYGQGTGYWYSLGMLVDKAGNDSYDAGVYSLAGSPHFALGVFQDDAGDDRYTGIISQSLGKGRDWSIGWFEDSAGNDWYRGNKNTLGSSDINGIGVFWDKQGDDTYIAPLEPDFGQSQMENATGLRELNLSLGLFVDGGGKDNYLLLPEKFAGEITDPKNLLPHPVAENNKTWCRPTLPRYVQRAFGCGIDAR